MINKLLPSFARRIARALRPRQTELLAELLPKMKFDFTPSATPKMLEIGFGNGDHLVDFARKNPNITCYGAEPFLNGVASLLDKVTQHSITNILVHTDDVRPLFSNIPEGFFDYIYIICPDPWPKRRQLKRRILNPEFLKSLKRLLKPTGELIIVTDHQDYAIWILKAIIVSESFIINSNNPEDYTMVPADFLQTKYQKKGLEKGYKVYYFKLDCKINALLTI